MAGLLDTQNKLWAEDKTKFGYRMLEKMGWKDGKGLGLNENGAVEHIRVRKKLSTSGVGASTSSREQWKVPAELASGLDDVLARLSSAATVGASVKPASGTVAAGGDGVRAKGNKGFFGRRVAGKNVSAYSETALREIFGGAVVASAPRAIESAKSEGQSELVEGTGGDGAKVKKASQEEKAERRARKEERAKRREQKRMRRERRSERKSKMKGVARKSKVVEKLVSSK